MFSLASVMYAMRYMVGLHMVGLSRCYGVVHAESSLMLLQQMWRSGQIEMPI